jgi:lipoic acid synthetase
MGLEKKTGIIMDGSVVNRLPEWFKTKLPSGEKYRHLRRILAESMLLTVCDSAICPNRGECWSRGVATFLIMGDVCTRSCRFCNVKTGKPAPLDDEEPQNVSSAIRNLGLRHVVITSVDRDDLPDGGASFFAEVIKEVKGRNSNCTVEVLVPDFKGSHDAAYRVLGAVPDIFGHNIETVPSLYHKARRGSIYRRSLDVLRSASEFGGGTLVKSGLMVGLGEEREELFQTMQDIRETGCMILTIGQYLSPSRAHLEVRKFYPPAEFDEIRNEALAMGFSKVMAGPLVRSSYLADLQIAD